jgi:opacity protein-like surface antigen
LAIFPEGVFKIGATAGYFVPMDDTVKEVYTEGEITYGLKLGVKVWNQFSLWFSAMQFKKESVTTLLADATSITLRPLTLSLRYTFDLGFLNPYLEAGYAYILYEEKSDIGDQDGEGSGYFADVGLDFRLSANFHVELGVRYSEAKVRPSGYDVYLGGTQAGLSLLVAF